MGIECYGNQRKCILLIQRVQETVVEELPHEMHSKA